MRRKWVATGIIMALIALFSYLAYDFFTYRSKYAVSDAAFIRSDSLSFLGFKVGGKVVHLTKREGEGVEAGELLARLDDRDFVLAKEGLEKEIASLKEHNQALRLKRERVAKDLAIELELHRNEYTAASHQIAALEAKIEGLRARYEKVGADARRLERLWERRLIARSDLEAAKSQRDYLAKEIAALRQELRAKRVQLSNAKLAIEAVKNKQKLLQELDRQIEAGEDRIEGLEKELAQIEEKIGYCRLYAPFAGRIAKRFVNIERVVEAGSPIYALVDPSQLHVEVLLSEKKLRGVAPGNRVLIEVDAYPDRVYRGRVEEILPASAATFALVPRDIASGEFTKLDQRFVVRIQLLNPTQDLRVGMGASVAIQRK
ncbi:MAG: HlyD family efflux transporter periplasmic adaptor subunit [Epsilonproteobacteria bacterium]|nr:HlyD family efflux transporter periplasmic adaptor subunit [Campylobacterota bacterium]